MSEPLVSSMWQYSSTNVQARRTRSADSHIGVADITTRLDRREIPRRRSDYCTYRVGRMPRERRSLPPCTPSHSPSATSTYTWSQYTIRGPQIMTTKHSL